MALLTRLPLLMAAFTLQAHAVIYDDGGTHDVNSAVGAIDVRDSATGAPTTVHARAGASAATVNVRDGSAVFVYDGAEISATLSAYEDAWLTVYGGSFLTSVTNAYERSHVTLHGGSFSAGTTNTLRVFHQATMTITGGTYTTPGTGGNVLIVMDDGVVSISGGSFNGRRIYIGEANETGTLTISGGSFLNPDGDGPMALINGYGAVTTIVGQSFNLPFGEITTDFTGLLTGVLANGDAITLELHNNRAFADDTARIVLLEGVSAVPEPAGWLLGALGAVPLLLRRRRARQMAATLALAALPALAQATASMAYTRASVQLCDPGGCSDGLVYQASTESASWLLGGTTQSSTVNSGPTLAGVALSSGTASLAGGEVGLIAAAGGGMEGAYAYGLAQAMAGDTLQLLDANGQPWSGGGNITFTVEVSGVSGASAGSDLFAGLYLQAYPVGFIDAWIQQAATPTPLASHYPVLFAGDSLPTLLTINMSAPTGPFELVWGGFATYGYTQNAAGSQYVNFDLGHTLTVHHAAPVGATLASASGLFPGSVAVVPEPASAWLLALGGACLWRWRRACDRAPSAR